MRPDIEAIEKQIAQAPGGPWKWQEQDLSKQPGWKTGFCGPPSLLDGKNKIIVNRGCEDCQEEYGNSGEALQLIVDYHNEIVPALLAYIKELEKEIDKCGHRLTPLERMKRRFNSPEATERRRKARELYPDPIKAMEELRDGILGGPDEV